MEFLTLSDTVVVNVDHVSALESDLLNNSTILTLSGGTQLHVAIPMDVVKTLMKMRSAPVPAMSDRATQALEQLARFQTVPVP